MTPSAKKQLQRRQRRWAEAANVEYDAHDAVERLEDNLRVALSSRAHEAFAGGPELEPRRSRRPKLHVLYSSAALVANVFDYWSEQDCAPLVSAFGLSGRCERLCFEVPFPTALQGGAPTADVVLTLDSGARVAVESKFSEWLTRRPRHKAVFKAKYFPPDRAVWAERGLPRCQALAEALQTRAERFKHLHAAQLLKHALGLAVSAQGEFALCYLFYDCPSRESALHRLEVDRFAAHVGSELRFSALTYQELYRRLRASAMADPAYLEYLSARYFPEIR